MNPFLDENGNPIPVERAVPGLLAAQQASVNRLNDIANNAENAPQQKNLSGLLGLSDAFAGTHYLQHYKAPPNPLEVAANVAKLRAIAQGAQNEVSRQAITDYLGTQKNNALMARILASGQKKNDLSEKDLDRMNQNLSKSLNTIYAARGAASDVGKSLIRASRAQTLIDQFKKIDPELNNVPPQQMAELASAMAALATNSNIVNQEQINNILPKSAQGNIASMTQWLSGEPTGAQQGKFVKLLEDSIQREKKTAERQARGIRLQNLPAHRSLYNADPQRVYQTAAAVGVTPEQVDDAFNANPTEIAKAFEELPVYKEGTAPNAKTFTKKEIEATAKKMGIPVEAAITIIKNQGHKVGE